MSSNDDQQTAKQAGKTAKSSGDNGQKATPKGGAVISGNALPQAANGGAKALGIIASLTKPGMKKPTQRRLVLVFNNQLTVTPARLNPQRRLRKPQTWKPMSFDQIRTPARIPDAPMYRAQPQAMTNRRNHE
ncbi:TPA: hypothetical protein L4F23_000912 [Pseudomonas aeruginosa]|uniref:hypothetical protein n=1 Tax=Pseudomonas aeruginosa TaxID=287 RepID=UPI00163BB38F|nr:hypothetical protein [Pseudomonas aeruginosa]MEE3523071.1 hypothetical protein [Pseudomonas aeruginosa]WNP73915.1 hypothetical protein ROT04_06165 [Pseudomonas aeruginosa]HBO1435488.1 hypothetical protein [Pseudomonas aeruginosa]